MNGDDRPTPAEVFDKLGTYGTAHHLATHLATEGVTGWRGNGTHCPVASYVHHLSGVQVTVGHERWGMCLYVGEGAARRVDGHVSAPVPGAVSEFVSAFDAGAFPELRRGRRTS